MQVKNWSTRHANKSERDREGPARLCSVWLRTLAKYLSQGKESKESDESEQQTPP